MSSDIRLGASGSLDLEDGSPLGKCEEPDDEEHDEHQPDDHVDAGADVRVGTPTSAMEPGRRLEWPRDVGQPQRSSRPHRTCLFPSIRNRTRRGGGSVRIVDGGALVTRSGGADGPIREEVLGPRAPPRRTSSVQHGTAERTGRDDRVDPGTSRSGARDRRLRRTRDVGPLDKALDELQRRLSYLLPVVIDDHRMTAVRELHHLGDALVVLLVFERRLGDRERDRVILAAADD